MNKITLKIITITKTEGGWQARVFGRTAPNELKAFGKTEYQALNHLMERIKVKGKGKFI